MAMLYRTPARPLSLLGNCSFQSHSHCHISRITVCQSPETELCCSSLGLGIIWAWSLPSASGFPNSMYYREVWATAVESSLWRHELWQTVPCSPLSGGYYAQIAQPHKCTTQYMSTNVPDHHEQGQVKHSIFFAHQIWGTGLASEEGDTSTSAGSPRDPLGIIPLLSCFLSISGVA